MTSAPPALTPDQAWSLAPLESLLQRRCAVSVGALTSVKVPERLVHALDHAVLGALRMTHELGVAQAAGALVRRHRDAGLTCRGASLAARL